MKDCKVSLHSFTLKGECEIVPLTDPETGQSKPAILQTICVPETRQTIQNMLDISEEEAATNILSLRIQIVEGSTFNLHKLSLTLVVDTLFKYL